METPGPDSGIAVHRPVPITTKKAIDKRQLNGHDHLDIERISNPHAHGPTGSTATKARAQKWLKQ